MKSYPSEMLKKRSKLWKNTKYIQILDSLPPRTRKVIKKLKQPSLHLPINSMYIHGKSLTGKTTQTWLHVMEWQRLQFTHRKSTDFIFIKANALYDLLRENLHDKKILNRFKTTKLLILDDLAVEKATEWVYEMFYMIIDYRYEWELTTFFTSNLSLTELMTKLNDDRVPSRILKQCQGNVIELDNKPYF